MLSGFACVYVLLYLLSFITSNNLNYNRHYNYPACVCVCVCVCLFVVFCHCVHLAISRNIGTYVFTATRKTLYIGIIIVIFAENASFRSYAGVICLPRMPLTAPGLHTKYGYQRNPRGQRLLRAHILNINMCTYILNQCSWT